MATPQTPLPPVNPAVGGRPQPDASDPTALTTQQLWREIEHLKEFNQNKLDDFKILVDQKFNGVQNKFEAIDIAVDKAFASAKEAIADQNKANAEATHKAEAGFKESITDLGKLITSENKSTNDKIDALTKRIDLAEGGAKGIASGWSVLIAFLGFAVGVIAVIIAVMK